jgi:hypothetical protein
MITNLLLVLAGHTRTRIARAISADGAFAPTCLQPSRVVDNGVAGAIEAGIVSSMAGLEVSATNVIFAPVGGPASVKAGPVLTRAGMPRMVKLGVSDGPGIERVPQASDAQGVTLDRLLVALAAHRYSRQACLVVDVGATMSIDYVNSYGVLQGGLIGPGLAASIKAWCETTGTAMSEVPAVGRRAKRTALAVEQADALLLGVKTAARGLVRHQLERVAEHAGTYPRVVATGDDAALLFEDDDIVETVVPELAMLGMMESWRVLAGIAAEESRLQGDEGEMDEDE